MIHKKIFFLLAAILLLSIFIFSKINVVSIFNKNEKMEEDNSKKEMYLKMLADPNTGKIPEGASLTEMEFYRNTFGTLAASKKNRGDAIWENKGPWNVGGRTRAFGMDIRDENILLAGSVSGGIWRSVNAGNSWQKVSLPNEHPGVVSLSQDKRAGKEDIWYALSGELSGTSASGSGAFYLGDGAFRSLDNGQTWQPLTINNTVLPTTFTINYQGGWRIATSPIDSVDACVYMACYGSIYRSIDSGNSWKIVLGIGNNSYYTDVIVSPLGIVYAALSSGSNTKGFFRSSDGINFTNITPTFFDANKINRTVIEINPSNENEVYFLSELEDSLAGGVETSNYSGTKEYVSLAKYEYLNGNGAGAGGNWQNLSQNLPVYGSGFDKFNCQGGYDLMIRFQPNSNYIFVGGTNLYRSTDGFQSKNNTTQIGGYGISTVLQSFTVYPNHHPDQHDVYFVPSNPKKMYSISDGGVIFTENCNATQVEWQNKSLGYVTSQFYQVSINEQIPFDSKMIAGLQDNGNYFTNNNSNYNHWTLPVNGDGSFGYIANDNSFYVMSTQQGNIRKVKLDDRGNLVNKKRIDPVGFTNDNYIFIHPFTVDAKDNNFMFLPIGKQMYRLNNLKSIALNNDNNKLTSGWEKIGDTINTTNKGTEPAEISALALSNDNTLYFGTSNRDLFKIENASSNLPVFSKLNTSKLPGNGYVNDIAIDPDSSKNVLICYSNYNLISLYFTNDGGANWKYVGGNLEGATNSSGANPSIRSVAILKRHDGKRVYFAGTSVGLYSTEDLILGLSTSTNTTVWKQESPDWIGANVVTDIKVRQADGYVVAATHGNGVFSTYYTGIKKPTTESIVTSLELYPNPVNDQLTFSFNLTSESIIEYEIINIFGQRVQFQNMGSHLKGIFTYQIPIQKLADGYYFLNIKEQTNNRNTIKKFIVNKN